jgi:peptidoglycan/xylan/chitin deacetylase (PgdA/CDA1 family)
MRTPKKSHVKRRKRQIKHSLPARLISIIAVKPRRLSRLKLRRKNYRNELLLLLGCAIVLLVAVASTPNPSTISDAADIASISDSSLRAASAKDVRAKLRVTHDLLAAMQDSQTKAGVTAVPDSSIAPLESTVNQDLLVGSITRARHDLGILAAKELVWQKQVADAVDAKKKQLSEQAAAVAVTGASKAPVTPVEPYWQVPILIYHNTPADFDNQLRTLLAKGYHDIDLSQLRAAIVDGAKLPSKPIAITYDDGYADQMIAFSLLKKYDMKATFYIIDGGDASNWCIGSGRKYGLSSQPLSGCGDQYLSWDQVRELDQSGLVTIGSHTVDHLNLPSVSAATQEFEIVQGKVQLEAQLGHSVRDFAYPYGGFNATSISIVEAAGFLSAVSTIPGTVQTRSTLFSLRRVRTVYDLP